MSVPRRNRRKPVNVALPDHVNASFLEGLLGALKDTDFKTMYLREEILSKYLDEKLVPASDRRARAIAKWLACEQTNAKTNLRLMHDECLDGRDFGWTTSDDFFADVRSLTLRILGRIPDDGSIEPEGYRPRRILDGSFHTNGASTRVPRSPLAAVEKLTGDVHCSQSARPYWDELSQGSLLQSQSVVSTESSVLFTVPKKSDIDRVACKEPEANMLLQRSVGEYIRRRLRRFGINLNDQTVNQKLAQSGLAQGLATVDLSSASDSITWKLVMLALPPEWWSLLDDLRVKSTNIDGSTHVLEMFSSMGNGFTFELESLLFYAFTRVIARRSGVRGRISVYGDDIICSNRLVPRLRVMFAYLGFKLNTKKTNYTGLFRESCGKHYHRGFDVTPFYIRRAIRSLPDLILHLNHLLEWDGRGLGFFVNPDLARFHQYWSSYVPRQLHGGVSVMDPSALVTGGKPRKRLLPRKRKLTRPEEASLTHWLMMRRCVDIPVDIDPQIDVGYKYAHIRFCEGRTSWTPYLITQED